MFELLLNYFKNTKNYSTSRFIFELTIVAFIAKLLFVIFFGVLFQALGINIESDVAFEQGLIDKGTFLAVILVIFFAGFETLVGQWFMIWFVSRFTKNIKIQIFFSALVFALLHVEPILIAAVFPIGIILAWAFLLYRRKSKWEAFYVTTSIHVLHNLFVLWLVWLTLD